MGHLEVVAVARDQPVGDQGLDHVLRQLGIGGLQRQLGRGHPPGPHRPVRVLLGEPDQDPSCHLTRRIRQRVVDELGGPAHRPGHAAGGEVAGERQRVLAAAHPGLGEGRRQQWERPGATLDLADGDIGQVRFHRQPGRPGGLLDHLPQLGLGHRRHHDQRPQHPLGQVGVLAEPADVVAPDHEHAARCDVVVEQAQHRVEEGDPLPGGDVR